MTAEINVGGFRKKVPPGPREMAAIHARIAADKLRQVRLAIDYRTDHMDRVALSLAIEAVNEIKSLAAIMEREINGNVSRLSRSPGNDPVSQGNT